MTDINVTLDKYGTSVYVGNEEFLRDWETLKATVPHGKICKMIDSLCADKENNDKYVIFISEYQNGMHEYKRAYRKFVFKYKSQGSVVEKTYYAKRVQRSRINEVIQNELIAKQRYIKLNSHNNRGNKNNNKKQFIAKQGTSFNNTLPKRKRHISAKYVFVTVVRWLCFSIVATFCITSLVYALMISSGDPAADEVLVLLGNYFSFEDIGDKNIESVTMMLFMFACGFLGYLATAHKLIPKRVKYSEKGTPWKIVWLIAYVITLIYIFVVQTKYQIEELCDGSFSIWFHSIHTWYWTFSLLFAICTIIWFIYSAVKNIPCAVNVIVYAAIIIGLPLILVVGLIIIGLGFLGVFGNIAESSESRYGSSSDSGGSSDNSSESSFSWGVETHTFYNSSGSRSGYSVGDRYYDDNGSCVGYDVGDRHYDADGNSTGYSVGDREYDRDGNSVGYWVGNTLYDTDGHEIGSKD